MSDKSYQLVISSTLVRNSSVEALLVRIIRKLISFVDLEAKIANGIAISRCRLLFLPYLFLSRPIATERTSTEIPFIETSRSTSSNTERLRSNNKKKKKEEGLGRRCLLERSLFAAVCSRIAEQILLSRSLRSSWSFDQHGPVPWPAFVPHALSLSFRVYRLLCHRVPRRFKSVVSRCFIPDRPMVNYRLKLLDLKLFFLSFFLFLLFLATDFPVTENWISWPFGIASNRIPSHACTVWKFGELTTAFLAEIVRGNSLTRGRVFDWSDWGGWGSSKARRFIWSRVLANERGNKRSLNSFLSGYARAATLISVGQRYVESPIWISITSNLLTDVTSRCIGTIKISLVKIWIFNKSTYLLHIHTYVCVYWLWWVNESINKWKYLLMSE